MSALSYLIFFSVSLSSCNISKLPNFLPSLENLFDLDLSNNLLTSLEYYPWRNVGFLNLRSNLLRGPLLLPPNSIEVWLMSDNKLSGEIPSSVCNLSSLGILDLSDNNLRGTIPKCLGALNSLNILDLQRNEFYGDIPDSFVEGNMLQTISLNDNGFVGPLPTSLRNCSQLEVLNLGHNKINDSFPHWLGALQQLQVLVLRYNGFHGQVVLDYETPSPFPKLQLFDLSHNGFSGSLPTSFHCFKAMMDLDNVGMGYVGDRFVHYRDSVVVAMKGADFQLERILTTFTTIDMSSNQFGGEIPQTLGKLNSLQVLNFSHNRLTGYIPSSMGNLASLESLDLSSNKLVGKIPPQLTSLRFLEVLNLSQNQLSGVIPLGNQFDTFRNDSYGGNLGLCGFPLSKSCNNKNEASIFPEEDDSAAAFPWTFALMGYGCGLVFGLSFGYIILTIRKPEWLVRKVEKAGFKLKKIYMKIE